MMLKILKQHLLCRILLLSILGILPDLGCRHSNDIPVKHEPGKVVRSISFEGNHIFKDREIKKYIQLKRKDRFIDDIYHSAFAAITKLYESAGYFQARITDVKTVSDKKKRIKITVIIKEGAPAILKEINFKWLKPIKDQKKIESQIALKKLKPASAQELNESVDIIKELLLDRAYPLGTVKESIIIKKDLKTAIALFIINPGPLCTIGKISIKGLKNIHSKYVYNEVEDFQGKPFNSENRTRITRALGNLNVFGGITVVPDKTADDKNRLNMTVFVTESDFRQLRLGVGVKFEPDKFLAWASAVYSDSNMFGNLNHFKLKALAGWALLPALWDVETHGPVALLEPGITKKGFLERKLIWNLKLTAKTDVEEDYQYFKPSITPSVSRLFFERLLFKLGYNFEYIIMWGISDEMLSELNRIYNDIINPMRLGELETTTRLMLTDRFIEPNNGTVLKLSYSIADKWLGSQVNFHKIEPSITVYWRIVHWLQFAIRAEAGLIFPFSGTEYIGMQNTFYLGGSNTIRGWGGKKLAPWETVCLSNGDCDDIHLGGNTMVLGNAEFRFKVNRLVSVITFLDVGDVQKKTLTVKPDQWNYTVGSGLRIHTPIGLFRADLGIRVNNPDYYKQESRWGLHLGLGEAF